MLDYNLASIYEVPTKVLNQAVKRNIKRFPKDFLFQLTGCECNDMRSQIVTSSQNKHKLSTLPYAFTEQGIAMLIYPIIVFQVHQRAKGSIILIMRTNTKVNNNMLSIRTFYISSVTMLNIPKNHFNPRISNHKLKNCS